SPNPCAVDLRARCAAAKSARRSNELSGGGCSPVCEPGPAVPWPMPGLSKSASAGSIAGCSGRAPLARVGFAGSFFECLAGSRAGFCFGLCGTFGSSGAFAIAEIWSPGYDGKRVERPIVTSNFARAMEGTVRHRRALTRRQVLTASAAAPVVSTAAPAPAQAAYPARPVKVVIPYPPAGGADTVGRLLFQKLGEMWGAQFVIDNRGGAGGTIAAAAVAKAESDGYTIMYDATAHSVNPSLYANLPYDTVKDFQAVFLAPLVTNLLLVNESVAVQSVADVIALAKATPGGLDWASSGNGTVQHLALEMFKHRAGIKLNHIPYRGGGPVLNDLIDGQVKFYFSNAAASIGHVQAGTPQSRAHTRPGGLGAGPRSPALRGTRSGLRTHQWQGGGL